VNSATEEFFNTNNNNSLKNFMKFTSSLLLLLISRFSNPFKIDDEYYILNHPELAKLSTEEIESRIEEEINSDPKNFYLFFSDDLKIPLLEVRYYCNSSKKFEIYYCYL
jgi:hypothetical protein